ncbi:MAG: histidine--tRNA ligase [Clostridia bacterium]|nr:histidine--tRNA ligase [Clostridia bacterium]
MKKIKPKILPGFMELLPKEQIAFNQMKRTIVSTYESFGFLPMDTPVMESSEILLAKAGGDTEKQIYRFEKGDTDLCLRFDLTVPFARFVAQNQNVLTFPFKRYQIGKVYRGERPQKGRFREFYQCDVDIVGNEKLDIIYDAEIGAVIISALKNLEIPPFVMHISNRKLLSGLLQHLGATDKAVEVLRIIDKLDKVGGGKMVGMLLEAGVSMPVANTILGFCTITGKNAEVIKNLKNFGVENEMFQEGIKEIEEVSQNLLAFGISEENFKINLAIARGLDYYTGTVFETFLLGKENLGSIASGGRYDNLAGNYTEKHLPGVGIAIGLTRLYDILRAEGLLSPSLQTTVSKALVVPMDSAQKQYAIKVGSALRTAGIKTEVYFEDTKFKNKMQYANKSGIEYAIILGEEEMKTGQITFKNLLAHTQETLPLEKAVELLK